MVPYSLNYRKEIEKAENGDLDAMFNVASYIIWGDRKSKLEPEMAERAVRYYMANIEAGDTDSMLDLGAMYLEGRGVEKDENKARELYERAAENTNPKAFRCLGNYWKYDQLEDGSPVATANEERLKKAYGYFTKGAELGEENCLYELGDFYRYGICVEKDENKAFELYDLAYGVITEFVMTDLYSCNDSYSDVCLRLAECYHYGIGTEVDMKEARTFIEIAKTECKRRLDDGDMYGGGSFPRANMEWMLIMQETGF
jgi:TPR repeat protein